MTDHNIIVTHDDDYTYYTQVYAGDDAKKLLNFNK